MTEPVDACLCPAYDEWVLEADGIRAVCLYGRHAGEIDAIKRNYLLVATDEEGGVVTRLHYRDGFLFFRGGLLLRRFRHNHL